MYAAEADLRRYLGRLDVQLTATSKPSTADALLTMAAVSGEIDAVLSGRGAVVPVAAPAWFVETLRDLNAIGTAARVGGALNPNEEGPASTGYSAELQALYDAGLKALREDALPQGVALTSSGGKGRSYWTSHPTDEDGNDEQVPTFGRRMQW